MSAPILKRLVGRLAAVLGLPHALVRRSGRPLVLYYHRVVEGWTPDATLGVSVEAFEMQVAHLSRRWNIVSLDEIEWHWTRGRRLPALSVALTFDDGYRDNYEHALPILKRYGVPAAIFLTTAYVDRDETFWWERGTLLARKAGARPEAWIGELRGRSEVERSAVLDKAEARVGPIDPGMLPRSLRWREVHEMSESGIAIGAHSRTHRDLTRLDAGEIDWEVRGSKEDIERNLGKPVRFFSYPFGRWHETARDRVRNAGYTLAFAGSDGVASPLTVPRRKVKEGHTWGARRRFSPALFDAEISGLLDRVLLRAWR